jgi:hypothetical protein
MEAQLGSVTFSVTMTNKQFLKMDKLDYDVVMKWFPPAFNVTTLEWNGHFGARLIVTCEAEDFARAESLMETIRNLVQIKLR